MLADEVPPNKGHDANKYARLEPERQCINAAKEGEGGERPEYNDNRNVAWRVTHE